MEGDGQANEFTEAELRVDFNTLGDGTDKGVNGQGVVLRLCRVNQGFQESILALNAAQVTQAVVVPDSVVKVVVVTASSNGKRLQTGEELASVVSDAQS